MGKLLRTPKAIGSAGLKSRRRARVVTTQYHKIMKDLAAIDSDKSLSAASKKQKKDEVRR